MTEIKFVGYFGTSYLKEQANRKLRPKPSKACGRRTIGSGLVPGLEPLLMGIDCID